jgi:hypothetical protein
MWSITEFLAPEGSFGVFLLVSFAMGGGAAWLAGRALATSWRPWWHLVGFMLILALAVRFIHFSVFASKLLLSPHYYLIDAAVCLIVGLIAFRRTRTQQMVTLYNWIYEPAGPFAWRRRGNSSEPTGREQG